MDIPKRIEQQLQKRAKAANMWWEADYEISEWLDKHCILVDDSCYHGGIEAVVNPEEANEEIRKAILEKKVVK